MANMYEELQKMCENHPIKVAVIDRAIYSRLNGEGALDQILSLFEE